LDFKPDLLVSGINRGSNLGNDVLYSGTVAAAMEGCLHGVASLAVSLHILPGDQVLHWESAAQLAHRVSIQIVKNGLPRRSLLNLNVPNLPMDQIAGIRPCRLGERRYDDLVDKRLDPRGKPYYWIGGGHNTFCEEPNTDGPLMAQSLASLTPLSPDLTHDAQLSALSSWSLQD
jgi:5'-nucleotidase